MASPFLLSLMPSSLLEFGICVIGTTRLFGIKSHPWDLAERHSAELNGKEKVMKEETFFYIALSW